MYDDENYLKLWRKEYKNIHPGQNVSGYHRILKKLGVKNNLWPRVWLIVIYLQSIGQLKFEIYDKHLEAIKQ